MTDPAFYATFDSLPVKPLTTETPTVENTLHRETVDLGSGVSADLAADHVMLTIHGVQLTARPTSRQDANRMSIALKKASRRLQAIGNRLPEGR